MIAAAARAVTAADALGVRPATSGRSEPVGPDINTAAMQNQIVLDAAELRRRGILRLGERTPGS